MEPEVAGTLPWLESGGGMSQTGLLQHIQWSTDWRAEGSPDQRKRGD